MGRTILMRRGASGNYIATLGQTCTPGVDPGCYGPVLPERQAIVEYAGEAFDYVKENPVMSAAIGGLLLLLLLIRKR